MPWDVIPKLDTLLALLPLLPLLSLPSIFSEVVVGGESGNAECRRWVWWRDLIGRYEVRSRLGTFSRKDRDIVLVLRFSCDIE